MTAVSYSNMPASRFEFTVSNFRRALDQPETLNLLLPAPFLGIIINLESPFNYSVNGVEVKAFGRSRYNFLSLPEASYEVSIPPGLHHSIALGVKASTLERYSQDYHFLLPLLDAARQNEVFFLSLNHHLVTPQIDADINELLYHVTNDEELRNLLIEVKAFDILFHAVHDFALTTMSIPGMDNDYKIIRETAAFLVDNIGDNFSLEDLAHRFGISQRNLQAGFRRHFRKTVHEFVVQHRMDAAKRMLFNESLSVKNVALAVGYKDRTAFSRAYKKHYGHFPKATREVHGSD
jgi:AraC-like DNA-binding protein